MTIGATPGSDPDAKFIHVHTWVSGDTATSNEGAKVLLRRRTTWHRTPNGSLVYRDSTLWAGIGRTGKAWHRWELTSMVTLRPGPHGYLLASHRTARGGRATARLFADSAFDLTFKPDSFPVGIAGQNGRREWLVAQFPGFLLRPLAHSFPIVKHNSGFAKLLTSADPAFVEAFASTVSAREIATRLFGVTRVRKDLIRAIGDPQLHPHQLELAWAMRGLVPIDHLVNFLKSEPKQVHFRRRQDATQPSRLRPLMLRLPKRSLSALLRELAEHPAAWDEMRDIRRMMHTGNHTRATAEELARVRTWRQLHDTLAVHRPGAVRRDRIPMPKSARRFDGLKCAGGLQLKVATGYAELVEWGGLLNNCIASYHSQARASRCVLLGVHQDGKLIAAAELTRHHDKVTDSYELEQLLGRFNRPLSSQVRLPIEFTLGLAEVKIGPYLGWLAAA